MGLFTLLLVGGVFRTHWHRMEDIFDRSVRRRGAHSQGLTQEANQTVEDSASSMKNLPEFVSNILF